MVKVSQIERDYDSIVAELRSRISATDLGWFAGIVDGEGCVHIARKKRDKGRLYYMLMIVVTNCDPRIIGKCQALTSQITGQQHKYVCTRNRGAGRAKVHQWMVRGESAAALLAVLRPFLISKCEQADLALRFQTQVRATKALNPFALGTNGRILPDEELDRRQGLYGEMRKLNANGHHDLKRLEQYIGQLQ